MPIRGHPILGGTILISLLTTVAAALWYVMPMSVDVVHPVRGPAVEAVYATGTVEPSIMLPIAARVTGRLVELQVDESDFVKKGQLLARIEDGDLQSSLEQLLAQERFAQQEYLRNEQLLKSGAVAGTVYDRAKAEWDATKAAVARATTEANFTRLVAPTSGRIIRRDGEIGQLIPANQAIFWLAQSTALRISAEVDEEDVANVKTGQDVLVRADAFPGQIFHARVRAMTPKGDPVARSYRVRIELAEDTPLLIGMTAEANIIVTHREDALLVPTSAVVQGKVWVVEKGRLANRNVTVGAKGNDRIEIGGVGPDDLIVAKPQLTLTTGTKVRVKVLSEAGP